MDQYEIIRQAVHTVRPRKSGLAEADKHKLVMMTIELRAAPSRVARDGRGLDCRDVEIDGKSIKDEDSSKMALSRWKVDKEKTRG
ncbi:hypothetical protein N7516_008083 [Penicillium verrucosum]|uniref:uncharacterized protein n=1 Tax=Penicillium verrucosum TaxID=60171 RepID=UPI0025453A07|nr:uncharacterized protein N7516_008083 [Penicillium verrucosum]KAJ5926310.1 hypothetical protein N7516_008083 [Penicillium verrucosum]